MSDLRKRAVTIADADGTAPDVSELIYDLLDSTIGAKLMQERAAGACEAVAAIIQIDADRFRGGSNPHHERLFKAAIYRDAATTIRAIPAPTDAEVLAAALELPQIKALVARAEIAEAERDALRVEVARLMYGLKNIANRSYRYGPFGTTAQTVAKATLDATP